jgi:hypothetical protein
MILRESMCKVAATLILVLACAGLSLPEAAIGRLACASLSITGEQRNLPTGDCNAARSCCCGKKAPKACGCAGDEKPILPPLAPDDAGRTLKWAPWTTGPATPQAGELTAAGAALFDGDAAFSSPQRSVQSRLCVWRI